MEDKFNKHVIGNRDLFDDLTPPGDMWDKISKDIHPKKKGKITYMIIRTSSVAAILLVALFAYNYFKTGKTTDTNNLFSEIRETEVYYNNLVSSKKQMVFKLTADQPEIKEEINSELALLDSAMVEIKEDLKDNISNREVVEAMIQNYRMSYNFV